MAWGVEPVISDANGWNKRTDLTTRLVDLDESNSSIQAYIVNEALARHDICPGDQN